MGLCRTRYPVFHSGTDSRVVCNRVRLALQVNVPHVCVLGVPDGHIDWTAAAEGVEPASSA